MTQAKHILVRFKYPENGSDTPGIVWHTMVDPRAFDRVPLTGEYIGLDRETGGAYGRIRAVSWDQNGDVALDLEFDEYLAWGSGQLETNGWERA